MHYLTHPLTLGVIAALVVYAYYWYSLKRSIENDRQALIAAVQQGAVSREQASQQWALLQNQSVPLMRPLVVGVIVALLVYLYKWYMCGKMERNIFSDTSEAMYGASDDITIEVVPLKQMDMEVR